ncbi:MAG TPA: ribosome maturation factor RimM [Spirochaetia bacterium]|nr:ribosome maturation factor RimM [Spirochaetia bacterium]
MPADLLAVGVVAAPYGVRGEVRGRSFSGEPDHFVALTEAVFRKGDTEKKLRIESVRPHMRDVVLKIAGIDTPEDARRLIGFEIWVPRGQAARLREGEYYTADLCRCSIWFEDELIGSVRSVWEGGPSQLLEVRNASGKTFLVPFNDHFVGEVDVEGGRILLREDEIVR